MLTPCERVSLIESARREGISESECARRRIFVDELDAARDDAPVVLTVQLDADTARRVLSSPLKRGR